MDGPLIRFDAGGMGSGRAALLWCMLRNQRAFGPDANVRTEAASRRRQKPRRASTGPGKTERSRCTQPRVCEIGPPARPQRRAQRGLSGIVAPDGRKASPAPCTAATERGRSIPRRSARLFPGPCRLP